MRQGIDPARREVWSFFSGALGLDLGLEKAGFHATLANEIDRDCLATIQRNRPTLQLIGDSISTLTAQSLRRARKFDDDVELMVGGPPCQSFSPGGKRAALSDPRGNLIYEYLRLVGEVRPKYFILENVANLTTAALRHRPIAQRPGQHWSLKSYDKHNLRAEGDFAQLADDEKSGSAIRQILQDVRNLGYFVTFGVLDAADYGAAQHRLRFVMVGARDFPPPVLPSPSHGPGLSSGHRTLRDVIGALYDEPGEGARYTDEVARYFALVKEGGNWRSLPPHIQPEAMGGSFHSGGGKTGFYRRLSWDAPSPTITGRANRKGSALCHPQDVRPLSVNECAAIQGFPADWSFHGSMSSKYQQVGNAVPVALGAAVGRAITDHSSASQMHRNSDDFDTLLDHAVSRLRSSARNKRAAKAETV